MPAHIHSAHTHIRTHAHTHSAHLQKRDMPAHTQCTHTHAHTQCVPAETQHARHEWLLPGRCRGCVSTLHQAAHCTQRQTAHVGIVNAHDGSSLQSLLESKLHGHTLQQAAHCTQRQSARLLTVGSMSAQWKQLALTAGQKVGYSLLDRRLVTPCQAAHCTK